MKRIFRFLLKILLLWAIVHSALIIWDGLSDEPGKTDVGIVLGNRVEPEGRVSLRLQQRLDKAVEGYQNGRYENLIVSGGIGKEGHWEGDVMRDYLVAAGIPLQSIVVDNEGDNTWLTAVHSREIMESRGWQSATVISQYYHISRSKLACRKAGILSVKGLHADFQWGWRDLWSLFREWPGYYRYYVR